MTIEITAKIQNLYKKVTPYLRIQDGLNNLNETFPKNWWTI